VNLLGVTSAPCDSRGMTPAGIIVLLLVVAIVVALASLTAMGERRRGGGFAVVVLAGLFFPLAWIGWYTHDELRKPQSSP
jgi:preprotein translocase subunit Sec61beta